jgi:hypothetical protein
MKPTKETVKAALLKLRRKQRSIASMMENDRFAFNLLVAVEKDPAVKARYQAVVNMREGLASECRAIADIADALMQRDEVAQDDIVVLAELVRLNAVKHKAVYEEVSAALAMTI